MDTGSLNYATRGQHLTYRYTVFVMPMNMPLRQLLTPFGAAQVATTYNILRKLVHQRPSECV